MAATPNFCERLSYHLLPLLAHNVPHLISSIAGCGYRLSIHGSVGWTFGVLKKPSVGCSRLFSWTQDSVKPGGKGEYNDLPGLTTNAMKYKILGNKETEHMKQP